MSASAAPPWLASGSPCAAPGRSLKTRADSECTATESSNTRHTKSPRRVRAIKLFWVLKLTEDEICCVVSCGDNVSGLWSYQACVGVLYTRRELCNPRKYAPIAILNCANASCLPCTYRLRRQLHRGLAFERNKKAKVYKKKLPPLSAKPIIRASAFLKNNQGFFECMYPFKFLLFHSRSHQTKKITPPSSRSIRGGGCVFSTYSALQNKMRPAWPRVLPLRTRYHPPKEVDLCPSVRLFQL